MNNDINDIMGFGDETRCEVADVYTDYKDVSILIETPIEVFIYVMHTVTAPVVPTAADCCY